MSADQYIESAKQGLINASDYLKTSNWRAGISAVRTCIGYVDTSGIMHDNNRLEERLWILKMVQQFAYHDQDAGGIREFSNWCELQYNNILCYYPSHVQALQGLGQAWLSKAQYWLSRVYNEDRSDDDDDVADRRRYTPDYVEAKAALIPAVDFFVRAVEAANSQGCLTGDLLAKRAEACMSLGNVSRTRDAQAHFKDALLCLRTASSMPGYCLPSHLARYYRENEHLLRL
ncbi:hypothetical protein DFH27DRAFT_86242 [Peziza echinospora]|nr:hypothetical protein DFH27DRAFT_86242 [Peziza echinospora]